MPPEGTESEPDAREYWLGGGFCSFRGSRPRVPTPPFRSHATRAHPLLLSMPPQGSLDAVRATAAPTISNLSRLLHPVTAFLGIGGPTGDLSSVLRIAGSPAYAMVGAAAVLAALYRAPLTGSLLLFELTKVGAAAVVGLDWSASGRGI